MRKKKKKKSFKFTPEIKPEEAAKLKAALMQSFGCRLPLSRRGRRRRSSSFFAWEVLCPMINYFNGRMLKKTFFIEIFYLFINCIRNKLLWINGGEEGLCTPPWPCLLISAFTPAPFNIHRCPPPPRPPTSRGCCSSSYNWSTASVN